MVVLFKVLDVCVLYVCNVVFMRIRIKKWIFWIFVDEVKFVLIVDKLLIFNMVLWRCRECV